MKTNIPTVIMPLIFPIIRLKLKMTIPINSVTKKNKPKLISVASMAEKAEMILDCMVTVK